MDRIRQDNMVMGGVVGSTFEGEVRVRDLGTKSDYCEESDQEQ